MLTFRIAASSPPDLIENDMYAFGKFEILFRYTFLSLFTKK